jgi:two-component system sensor histidine kinase VicK
MINPSTFSSPTPPGNTSFVYDINLGRFTYLDSELIELLKINTDSPIDAILSMVYEDDIVDLEQQLEHLLNGSFKGNAEFRVKVEGTGRWLRLTPYLVQLADDKIIAGNIVDFTAEVNNLYSIQKFANKKNSILTMLSHDLRGPLEIARMIARSFSAHSADTTTISRSKNLLKIIQQASDLINDLIQREVDETIKVDLVKSRIDIATKLKEYTDELRSSEDALQRVIRYSASAENIYIYLDEAKFVQIINNLVSNALKFTRDGDTISLSVQDQGDNVLFVFSDTGVGIPEKFHATLFEKFTPARRKGLQGEPSIGIGMSIVKTLLDWHQGTIRVESKENEGTTFYFEVPKNQE